MILFELIIFNFCTDQDDAVFKKPLFSDNEDDDADDVLSEDEKSGNWRKERFKRESFLSQVLFYITFLQPL